MMDTGSKRPILVTGSHRSGSTWVGRMIALSPAVAYIHEPFNVNPRAGDYGGVAENWFTYVYDGNAARYEDYVRACLQLQYPLGAKLRASRSPRDAARSVRQWAGFAGRGETGDRPLMKDPHAIFSAEWLARTFDMQVIVLVRHPAAFAGSIKRAGWSHPFGHFLNQPRLMTDHLADFRPEVEAFAAAEQDLVDQAILLWNMIHAMILTYRDRHADWCFVRHEDLSAAPVDVFGRLYAFLGLDYPAAIQSDILAHSTSSRTAADEDVLSIRRDSKRNVRRWEDRLTDEEIGRVRAGTRDISRHFYGDADW